MSDQAVDWRGTPITPGRLVVYGASVGRSIELVEGVVVDFTKSGRVNVRVIRRSYQSAAQEVVHVGHDRLTIVDALPESTVPTQAEKNAEIKDRLMARQAMAGTHDFPCGDAGSNYRSGPCRRCAADPYRFDSNCPIATEGEIAK